MTTQRKYWLAKSEPGLYSWDDLVDQGRTFWDGVRNHQARNNLLAMSPGDVFLFYHSVTEKSVVGVARVVSRPCPDPAAPDRHWVGVEVEPWFPLERPVTLAAIKADPVLCETALVRQSRLSVMPVTRAQYERILSLSGAKEPPQT